MDSIPAFISELIRSANEITGLSKSERSSLLVRAASTISDYRIEIAFSMTPANEGGPDDVVHELNEMARLINIFAADEVAAAMLNAAEVIKDCRVILEAKALVKEDNRFGDR